MVQGAQKWFFLPHGVQS